MAVQRLRISRRERAATHSASVAAGAVQAGLAFSRRERAARDGIKKGRISRAKRSVACACWTASEVDALNAILLDGAPQAR